MVAQLLGLKLRVLAGSFRRSPWHVVGTAVAMLYGLVIAVLVVGALIAARSVTDVAVVRDATVLLGSFVVLGFLLLPLLFGVDDTLDPRGFALYGIPSLRLATGLGVASLLSVPVLALAACALATIVTWSTSPGAALLAALSALIAIPTCALAARVTTSVAAFALATRRSREIGGVVAVLVVLLFSVLGFVTLNTGLRSSAWALPRETGRWLGWTPFGAVWAIPGDAARGEWGRSLLELVIALAFLGVLWLAWSGLVSAMMVTPARSGRPRDYAGLGWFARLHGGRTRAVAARAITYWARDPRYWVTLVAIPVVPAMMVLALLVAGVPGHYLSLIPLPIMCLFLGWTVHNDVAADGTALWLHVVSGVRGTADRIGRTFPVLLIGVPLIVVGSLVTTAIYGDWSVLVGVAGLSLGVLLIGIGLSSVTSALFPYPTTKPGESAFTHPQSAGGAAALIQSFSFLAIVILASPVIACFLLGLMVSPLWLIGTAALGVVIGCAALAIGIRVGGRIFDARGPELMMFATTNG